MRQNKGFTLIELLIAITIIGILAAIAIPNLLNAVQRGKQKRTMSDMRTLATAVEAYAVDNNLYPDNACPSGSITTGWVDLSPKFQDHISPTYVADPPMVDGWRNAFGYAFEATAGQAYGLVSKGRNNSYDGCNCGTTTDFNDDIVYSNGTFIQWPEGSQN